MGSEAALLTPARRSTLRWDAAAAGTFAAYAAGSVVLPVAMVQVADDLGFPLAEGGMGAAGGLHLGRTVAMVLAMLACGFLAARFGKRRTLGASVLLMTLGVALCAAAPGYGVLVIALGVAGLGEGGIEAIATPFVEKLHPEAPGRYINLTHAFWSVGVAVSVLGAGWWLSTGGSWRVAVAACAAASAVAAVALLWPGRGTGAYPDESEACAAGGGAVWAEAKALARLPRFWCFFAAMGFAGGGEFCLTFWIASFVQIGYGAEAWAGGAGTAIFAGGMFLGRLGSGWLVPERGLKPLLLGAGAAGVVVTSAIPFAGSLPTLFVLLALAGLATAPFWPSVQALGTHRLKRADPTVLLVGLSCAGVPGCGLFAWGMGELGDAVGLRAAFALVPFCFAGVAACVALADR